MTAARRRALAPWTRTQLRTASGAAAALCLLVLATAFLAAALPSASARADDTALRRRIAATDLQGRSITGTTDPGFFGAGGAMTAAKVQNALEALVRPPLVVDKATSSYGDRGLETVSLTGRNMPRPDGLAPVVALAWQPGQAAHVHLVEGRLPHDPVPPRGPDEQVTRLVLETAVSEQTARILGVHAGARLSTGTVVTLEVVGVYRPLDPSLPYWVADQRLLRPELDYTTSQARYWNVEGLVAPGATDWFTYYFGGSLAYWWLPLVPGSLHADEVGAARGRLAGLLSGPEALAALGMADFGDDGITLTSGLPRVLDEFNRRESALHTMLAVGAAGAAGAAAAVLLMAAGLAAERRAREVALLRARGGGMAGLGLRLLAETAAATTPGAAAGTALALVLLPTRHVGTPVLAGVAVWALATIGVPVRILARHRVLRAIGRGDDVLTARPTRRRTVAELAVALAAVAAVASVRRRGTASGADLLLTCAPVLLGLVGAIVVARLYPGPLRAVGRLWSRRRSVSGFLGLARAGRAPAGSALLHTLALLLALTAAVFGTEMLAGITQTWDHTAAVQVGADARVEGSSALPPALVTAVSRSPGVRSVVPVDHPGGGSLGNGTHYQLYAVDPQAYSALARKLGTAQPLPTTLLDGGGSGPLPALASPALARRIGTQLVHRNDIVGTYQLKVVGTVGGTLFTPDGNILVVSAPALARTTGLHRLAPELLLIDGPVDGPALHATVARAHTTASVEVRSEVVSALDRQPEQASATTLYLAMVAAAALFAALAVLLALLHAAPGRAALLARLRTMGLTPSQGYRLILVEALPQVLAGVVAGIAVGLAAVPLFGPSVDLAALAGTADAPGAGPPALRPALLPLAGPGLAVLLLAVAVVAVEAAVVGRRQLTTELRAGDQR
ncbi:FtsX-like permease family protein [Peterkaempfera sp. SMS 1(5)a]|uniref:FtsX-like permease family protein n=1 Tax=Peterkaempfera podocarpi TaxID=3232308 RepID=UPI00366AE3EE